MTTQDRLIITAYTGVLMTDLTTFKIYAEELLGYPLYTHDFGDESLWADLKMLTRKQFLALCEGV